MQTIESGALSGVWSAVPTPFDDDMEVDIAAIERVTEHQLQLGMRGLFIAGSCGEGPWMPNRQRSILAKATVATVGGRVPIAVQVSDNSAARILDNIRAAEADGADLAVIAPPALLRNATPDNLRRLYLEAISSSSLPVIVYDLGRHAPVWIPAEVLADIYAADNVVAIKDSSSDAERRTIAIEARRRRPDLRLFNGDEFHCVQYLEHGYDGLMLGGAAITGALANDIMQACSTQDSVRALALEDRMREIQYAMYGESLECWLAGIKTLLVQMGLFGTANNYLGYTLSERCRDDIGRLVAQDAEVLFPYREASVTM